VDLWFNVIVVSGSLLLFCYWFRYCCMLILAAESSHDYTAEIAEANDLAFPEVRARLRQHDATDLEKLHESLERDFAILAHLLAQTHTVRFNPCLEEGLLTIHFRTMSACVHLTPHRFRAADALKEMTRVVAHLANQLGEHQTAANLRPRGITAWK